MELLYASPQSSSIPHILNSPRPWSRSLKAPAHPESLGVQERYGSLRNNLPSDIASVLTDAIEQVSFAGRGSLSRHSFALSRVTTLHCGRDWGYPTALLFADAGAWDRQWIPYTDDAIGRVHADVWLARSNARDAFLESQFLMAAWFGLPLFEIALMEEVEEASSGLQEMIVLLGETGRLRVWLHSDERCGYFALALYQGHPEFDSTFAMGHAYRSSALAAVTRAVGDVWRASRRRATQSTRETVLAFPCWSVVPVGILGLGEVSRTADRSHTDPFAGLREHSETAVVFEGECASGVYCRVADPSFYLHGNPAEPVNLDNPFAKRLGLAPAFDRLVALPVNPH